MRNRVVVTGMSGITALGNTYPEIEANFKAGKSAIKYMPEWEKFTGLHTKLGAPVQNFTLPAHYDRKATRSMGPVAKMATRATELALIDADLLGHPVLSGGDTGIAYGSCTGSTEPVLAFMNMFSDNTVKGITATTYIKMMSHTCAVNMALFFKVRGRVIPTSSACTSGSQGVGYAYEAIRNGYQKVMIAGGAEELCPSEVAVFDTLFATSVKNTTPELTPSPFDKGRDGLVLGEGAGTLILEDYEHAKARGARICAELVGFGTNCDAQHVTQPDAGCMQKAIELALKDAGLKPSDIGYVNAHGTATEAGDIAETTATHAVFGEKMPVSSFKSYYGHTLGACGAIEAWLSIEMMNHSWFAPTLNLNTVDERCGKLDFIKGEGREINCNYVMSNNFAFGGINTSLIFKKWNE
jgi:3-oxoacyl-[acyl-carrier-protein] synthase II